MIKNRVVKRCAPKVRPSVVLFSPSEIGTGSPGGSLDFVFSASRVASTDEKQWQN
jgi:hypothetical protein